MYTYSRVHLLGGTELFRKENPLHISKHGIVNTHQHFCFRFVAFFLHKARRICLLWGFLSRLWRTKRAGVRDARRGGDRFGLWRVKRDVGFVTVRIVLDFTGVCGVRSAAWVL